MIGWANDLIKIVGLCWMLGGAGQVVAATLEILVSLAVNVNRKRIERHFVC